MRAPANRQFNTAGSEQKVYRNRTEKPMQAEYKELFVRAEYFGHGFHRAFVDQFPWYAQKLSCYRLAQPRTKQIL